MDRLLGILGQVGSVKVRCDDDFIDKLNHRYTTFILVIFAIVVSTKQYVGEPITCWCPAQFTDNHEDFTNKICWVSNTYYVPLGQKSLPEEGQPRLHIGYYQWVPMILLGQALLFYVPCMIWRYLNNKAGINVNNIVEAAATLTHTAYTDQREKTIRFMAKHMDRYLGSTRPRKKGCLVKCKHLMSRTCCLVCGRKYGNFLSVLYVITKLIYVINAGGQLFMLNAVIGTGYDLYGYEIMKKLIRKEDWAASEMFPRVTLCDFHIRALGNIQRHTVQCVLPINLFNEKIFLALWFWFVLTSIANIISLLTWVGRTTFRLDQVRYVKHHLKALDLLPSGGREPSKRLAARFVSSYLRLDGVLILRIIGTNTNELVVAELLAELFAIFRLRRPVPADGDSDRTAMV